MPNQTKKTYYVTYKAMGEETYKVIADNILEAKNIAKAMKDEGINGDLTYDLSYDPEKIRCDNKIIYTR